jgi:hypothetical protein
VLVFGERVRLGGWLAVELIGAIMIAAASVELARSPLISGEAPPSYPAPRQDQETQPDLR